MVYQTKMPQRSHGISITGVTLRPRTKKRNRKKSLQKNKTEAQEDNSPTQSSLETIHQLKAVLMKPIRNFVMKQSTHGEKEEVCGYVAMVTLVICMRTRYPMGSAASHAVLPGGELGILPKHSMVRRGISYT